MLKYYNCNVNNYHFSDRMYSTFLPALAQVQEAVSGALSAL